MQGDNNVNVVINKVCEDLYKKKLEFETKQYITKERFSLLGTLPNQHYENLHSNILAYLLNPNETHDCGNYFLNIFIDEIIKPLEKPDFNINNTENAEVITEFHIGNKTTDEGGRIDILINGLSRNIIIENKVYAADQENQLIRYKSYDETAIVLYLSPNGKEASNNSSGMLKEGVDYFSISYAESIISWLDRCIQESWDKPNISVRLVDYKNLVERVILNTNISMDKERINTLLKPENCDILKYLYSDDILYIRDSLREKFLIDLRSKLGDHWTYCKGIHEVNDDLSKLVKIKNHKSGLGLKYTNAQYNILDIENPLSFHVEIVSYNRLICGVFVGKEFKELNIRISSELNSIVNKLKIVVEAGSHWSFHQLLKVKLSKGFYKDEYNYMFLQEMDSMVSLCCEEIIVMLNAWKEIIKNKSLDK